MIVAQVIVEVLGTPTERDMRFVQRKSAKDAIDRMGARPKVPFTRLFPRANPLAVDLLEKMLVFDPEKRITATVSVSLLLLLLGPTLHRSHAFTTYYQYTMICTPRLYSTILHLRASACLPRARACVFV